MKGPCGRGGGRGCGWEGAVWLRGYLADYYLFGGGGAVGEEGDADHGGAGGGAGYFYAVEGEVADAQRGAVAVEAVDAGAAVVGGDGEDALVAGTLDGDGGRVKGLGGDYPYLVALDLEVGGDGDVDAVEALDAQRGAEGGGALVVLEVEDAGCGVAATPAKALRVGSAWGCRSKASPSTADFRPRAVTPLAKAASRSLV